MQGLRNFFLLTAIILIFAAATSSAQQQYNSTQALFEGVEGQIDCHQLRKYQLYVAPGEFVCWNLTGTCLQMGNKPVEALPAWNPPGTVMKSIEFRKYEDGEVIYMYPLIDDKTNRLTHWAVYRASLAKDILKLTNRNGNEFLPNPLKWPVELDPKVRQEKRSARDPIPNYNLALNRDVETAPYYTKSTKRHMNVPMPGGLQYFNEFTEEAVHYEQCDLAGVFTPKQIVKYFNRPLRADGWKGDCLTDNPDAYQPDPHYQLEVPRCMAQAFVGDAARRESDQILLARAQIVPFLGAGMQFRDCAMNHKADPWCWGEAGVTGLTDVVTFAVPLTKVAVGTGFRFVKPKFVNDATKVLGGIAIGANSVLAARDLYDRNHLAAISRLAMAADIAVVFKTPRVPGKPRRYQIVEPKEKPCSANAEKVPAPEQKRGGTCGEPSTELATVHEAGGCCPMVPNVNKLVGIYNLIDDQITTFFETLDKLGAITKKLKHKPGEALQDLMSLGSPAPRGPKDLTARQWGDLKIAEYSATVDDPFIVYTEAQLQNKWENFLNAANGNVAKAKIDLAEQIGLELINGGSNRWYHQLDKSHFNSVRIKNGEIPPQYRLPGSGSVNEIWEEILARETAIVRIEEILHGSGGSRIKGKGIYDALNNIFYFPHTKDTEHFYCWIEGLSEEQLSAIFQPSSMPSGITLKDFVKAQAMEADIAFWLREHGIPFRESAMQGPNAYASRKFVVYWMENVRNVSYWAH